MSHQKVRMGFFFVNLKQNFFNDVTCGVKSLVMLMFSLENVLTNNFNFPSKIVSSLRAGKKSRNYVDFSKDPANGKKLSNALKYKSL